LSNHQKSIDILVMKEFLRKIKLIDSLTINLNISREEFVQQLLSITDEGSTSLFSNPFEAFSSRKKEFKGQVHFDHFQLRRKKKLFKAHSNMALASGTK
jgi:hypothetical protein